MKKKQNKVKNIVCPHCKKESTFIVEYTKTLECVTEVILNDNNIPIYYDLPTEEEDLDSEVVTNSITCKKCNKEVTLEDIIVK